MTTQIVGLQFATQSLWRYVLFLSAAFGVFQIVISSAIAESPVWLSSKGRLEERKNVVHRIWGFREPASAVEPLLEEGGRDAGDENVKIPQLFTSKEFRKPLAIVCLAMLTQQISGMPG